MECYRESKVGNRITHRCIETRKLEDTIEFIQRESKIPSIELITVSCTNFQADKLLEVFKNFKPVVDRSKNDRIPTIVSFNFVDLLN